MIFPWNKKNSKHLKNIPRDGSPLCSYYSKHQVRKYGNESRPIYPCGAPWILKHGGQITFVFPFIQLTPTMFETKYTRGDFWFVNPDKAVSSMLLVVTRGLGMSLAPIRYNSTPEVTLITLKRK